MIYKEGRRDINIIDFEICHVSEAMKIAKDNYEEERRYVAMLPKVDLLPDLTYFAENKLGVAAFEGNKMLGFLCVYRPIENAFGTTNVKGVFSPVHAHGVVTDLCDYRDRIYSLLYQEAARKWVKEGILSHAIALYTHDREAINSFYYNGFGLRCMDLIRSLEEELPLRDTVRCTEEAIECCEVPRAEWKLLLPYHNALITHLGDSPSFMKYNLDNEEEFYNKSNEYRYFSAKAEGNHIAYIKLGKEGENFATLHEQMMNICGAYCNSHYRGTGVYQNLLSYLIKVLKAEGYQFLGVDCESFNPTARGFWSKYFTQYTHSVVRRIDDKAILK